MDQGGPEMTPAGEPQNEGERMCPPSQFVPEYLIHIAGERYVKSDEVVALSLEVQPPPGPHDITEDDCFVSLKLHLARDDFDVNRLDPKVSLKNLGRSFRAAMAADLADAVIESGSIKIYLADADRNIQQPYTMVPTLVDLQGRVTTQEPSLRSTIKAEAAAHHVKRIATASAQRAKNDTACFCMYADLPDEFHTKNDKIQDDAAHLVAETIRCHFNAGTALGTWTGTETQVHYITAKTRMGNERHTKQFFITNQAGVAPLEYVNTDDHVLETGQPPLEDLKFISMGGNSFMPTTMRLDKQTRTLLGVKGCCLKKECTLNSAGRCKAADNFFEARRAARRFDQNVWAGAPTRRQEKRERQRAIADSGEAHAQSQMEQSTDMCRAWELGRCSRNHPHRHGSEDETCIIDCCSQRQPGQEGYSEHYAKKCPFGGKPSCIYMHS